MLSTLLALRDVSTWGLTDFLKAVVIVLALLTVAYLACAYFEVKIPPVLIKIVMVCVIAFFAIIAINFLASL